jgi:LacI family transcriptional regulator
VRVTTIHDVARKAGVAPITVSRVINNSGYASESTRQKVLAAAAELGYVPNRLARSLRLSRSYVLALVLTDITNPFFTTIARGVEDVASAEGYTVTFCNTDENAEKERRNLERLLQQQVDGILLVPALSNAEAVFFVQEADVPLVVLDRRIPEAEVDMVRCDSERGAYQLVCHLLDLGHRSIAILTGPAGTSTADDRLAGYQRALREHGLQPAAQLTRRGTFSQDSGYEMASDILSGSAWPTAFLAANNFIAIGAFKALRDHGYVVPDDFSLVAFDDLPAALMIDQVLTVAAQPAYEMARQATRLLLDRLAGNAPKAPQKIILPTELIVRGSSGPPPE